MSLIVIGRRTTLNKPTINKVHFRLILIFLEMPKFILSYFSPIDKIGEGLAKAVYLIVPGSHGIVHKCLNRKTGHLVAIKRIKLNWSDPDSYSTALSEIAFLKELKHSNIVT